MPQGVDWGQNLGHLRFFFNKPVFMSFSDTQCLFRHSSSCADFNVNSLPSLMTILLGQTSCTHTKCRQTISSPKWENSDPTLPYPTLPYPTLPYPTPTLPYPSPTIPSPTLPTLPYPIPLPYHTLPPPLHLPYPTHKHGKPSF